LSGRELKSLLEFMDAVARNQYVIEKTRNREGLSTVFVVMLSDQEIMENKGQGASGTQ